jgi:hypothetical protein
MPSCRDTLAQGLDLLESGRSHIEKGHGLIREAFAQMIQLIANQEQRIDELTGEGLPTADVAETPDPGPFVHWSTYRFPGGAVIAHTQQRLFATPRGHAGQGVYSGLTLADTNLKEGGRLPVPGAFRCTAIKVDILGGSFEDVTAIRDNGVLLWDWLQAAQEIAPLSSFVWDGFRSGVRSGLDILIPANTTVGVILSFGLVDHVIDHDVKVRVALVGEHGLGWYDTDEDAEAGAHAMAQGLKAGVELVQKHGGAAIRDMAPDELVHAILHGIPGDLRVIESESDDK